MPAGGRRPGGGRKPKPTSVKRALGFRASHINNDEPVLLPGVPPAPESMPEVARTEWNRVAPMLYNAGCLTEAELAVLVSYCESMALWREMDQAFRAMQKEEIIDHATGDMVKRYPYSAIILKTDHGSWIQNPAMLASRKAMSDMVKYAVELGMTPSARSRIKANPPIGASGAPAKPAAKYLDVN